MMRQISLQSTTSATRPPFIARWQNIRVSPMSCDEKAKYSPLAALAPLKSIFEAARQASLAPRLGQPASAAPETRP